MSVPPPPPDHDFFPVRSVAELAEDNTLAGVVSQLDLTELQKALAPRLADPDSAFTASEIIPRPDIANPTAGPHRYTVYVPHDDGSRLNMGAAHWPAAPGISADTKTHIHLNAYEACPTFLNLGASPVTIGPVGWHTAGYTLVTEGASNHTSKLEVNIASQTEGIGLTAKTNLVLNATDEDIAAEAGKAITLKAANKIALSVGTQETINAEWHELVSAVALTTLDVVDFGSGAASTSADGKAVVGAAQKGVNFAAGFVSGNAAKLKDQWVAAASGHVSMVLGHVATLAGLVLSFKKTWGEPKPGTSGWVTKSAKASWILDAAAELKAIYGDYDKIKNPKEPGGILLEAESTIALNAKGTATVNGVKGASLTGFKAATVSGLSASLKGHKSATVWGGLGASVKGLAGDVAVSSDLKGATVKGKKDVEMSSETGKATFTGKQDAQLNSTDGKAYVHGKNGSLLASGKFGVVARPDFVEMGMLKSAEPFGDARVDDIYVSFSDQGVDMQTTTDNQLHLNKSGIVVLSKKLDVKSDGKITIKAPNIDIG